MSSRGIRKEEVLGKAYDSRLIGRLWQFVRPQLPLLLLAFLLIPTTIVFEVAQPYLLSLAIDTYIAHHITDGLDLLVAVFMGLVLMHAILSYAQQLSLQLVGQRAMHKLRMATYEHVLTRRSAFFDRVPVGRLLTRLTNDVQSVSDMFSSGVVTLIADVVRLLAIVSMMLYLSPWLTAVTFLCLPLLVVLIALARKLMRASYRQIRVQLAAMNAHAQENISGLRVLQLFSRQSASEQQYRKINKAYREAYQGSILADASMYAVVEAIGIACAAGIAWYAGASINQSLTIGIVVAFIEYINKLFAPIKDFSQKYAVMQSAMAAAERIVGLLDTEEEDAPLIAEGATTTTDAAVEFRDVHFRYRIGEPVLRGLQLSVAKGKKVAIVGATGSGKSTLIKLLARLYEPQEGEIFIDGVDIRTLPAQEVRQQVTVVNQDVFLFHGSVRDNVRLGSPDASDEDVDAALRQIGADKIISAIRDGGDQEVGDRGESLSAGERQLVAFARALVRNPSLLILDEATAHVDPDTERTIENALEVLMEGRTSLVIAHRLSTIRNADTILVLHKGVVAEQGTYQDLLALGGRFAKLEQSFSRTD